MSRSTRSRSPRNRRFLPGAPGPWSPWAAAAVCTAAACAVVAEPPPSMGPAEPGAVCVQRRLGAMGTWLDLEVEAATRARALRASEDAVQALAAVEARLSTWTEDSELARLNRAPVGVEVVLSPALAHDLTRARALAQATGGAFDPALGPLVQAWGLRHGGASPAPDELARARAASGPAGFAFVEAPGGGLRARRRHAEAALEEGAFGKGLGLDAALERLREAGVSRAWLDLGGQVAFLGPAERVVALSDPRDRGRAVLELTIAPGSLATSGNAERGIVVDGVRRSHLLDPRTGAPAPERGSATVWARDATTADALSTALYVLGPESAARWQASPEAAALGPLEFLFLHEVPGGLEALASAGWRGRLRALAPDLHVRFLEPLTNSDS